MKVKCCCSHKKSCSEEREVKLLKVKDAFVSNAPVKIDREINLIAEIQAQLMVNNSSDNFSSDNFLRDHSPPGRSYDLLLLSQSFLI